MGPRVQLGLHDQASAREYRELAGFVRSCIDRLERDSGRAERWTVNIARDRVCYACHVTVQHRGAVFQASGHGFDGAVAAAEALRQLETRLHANREGAIDEVNCGSH